MWASMRPFLLASLGTFLVACGDSQQHTNVPDEPGRSDETPVIVLGRPTHDADKPKEPIEVAEEEPHAAIAVPGQTASDADFVESVRDSRRLVWAPRARQLLVTELQGLEALLNSMPTTAPDRPRILRRLADDYLELKNAARRDKQQLLTSSGSSRNGSTDETNRLEVLEKAAQQKALLYYGSLVNNYADFCDTKNPTDPSQNRGCIDDVLYYLGLEYLRLATPNQTRKYHLKLIQAFPNSPLLPNAYLVFGELFFAEGSSDPAKLDFAKQAYEEVLKYPPPQNEVYGFAHYRLAQVMHQKQDEQNALAHFMKAIDFALNFSTLRSSDPLRRAAQREIISSYANVGDPRKAEAFFKRLTSGPIGSNGQLVGMLDSLVATYLRANKRTEAIGVCTSFSGGSASLPSCDAVAPPVYLPNP